MVATYSNFLLSKEDALVTPTEAPKKIIATKVVRHDGPLMIPKKMTYAEVIEVCQRNLAYDNEDVNMSEKYPVFVWDGALASAKALTEQFGMALQEPDWHPLFGKMPPQQMSIPTGVDTTIKVPWGKFMLPGIQGTIQTSVYKDKGRLLFQLSATVKHKDEDAITKLFSRVREICMVESIYRGKAIEISFHEDNGQPIPIPTPTFLKLFGENVVFSKLLTEAIEDNILAPIRYSDFLRKTGTSLKRSTLLAGPYGTGKTLTSDWVARVAVENSWTFMYVRRVEELVEALHLAPIWQPVVVFAEDIDRAAGPERTDEVNKLLNTIDGIGNKNDEIITILTSNHPEMINEAMRRSGRIDLTLAVNPPDADAVIRLALQYGRGLIEPGENLSQVGEILAGSRASDIKEVVNRAKLSAVNRTMGKSSRIVAIDIERAASVYIAEKEQFKPVSPTISAWDTLGKTIKQEVRDTVREVVNNG